MGFARSTVAGFVFGTALSIGLGSIKIRTPKWTRDLRTEESLTKKETLARMNDQADELEIMKAFFTVTPETVKSFEPYYQRALLLALTDPFWADLMVRLKNMAK